MACHALMGKWDVNIPHISIVLRAVYLYLDIHHIISRSWHAGVLLFDLNLVPLKAPAVIMNGVIEAVHIYDDNR